MSDSLSGKWVLVTRPVHQAEPLCRLIEQNGGKALRFPTLEIRPTEIEQQAIAETLASDWLIFTSINAVDFALKAFNGKMPRLQSINLAAVGKASAKALLQAGLNVACVPEQDFSSDGLLAEPPMQWMVGQRITIVRGVGGREKLAKTLQDRGAEINYLEVYRRCRPKIDTALLVRHLEQNELAAITVTSGEALENLLAMLEDSSNDALRKIPLIVVSERIAQLAEQQGFVQIIVSGQPSDAAILERLTMLLNGENSGRSN
ncbi:MAG: uroporphyrinogen-III synthase [Gammaproteobacteria bacterium]